MVRTMIEDVRLFDGSGTVEHSTVVIDGESIAWVGSRHDAPSAPDAERTSGPGKTLLPGLIDCHTHLMMSGGGGAREPDADPSRAEVRALLRALVHARECLAAGVTAVRDLGWRTAAVVDLAEAIGRGEVDGPRIIAAARFIAPIGGYIAGLARECAGPDDARRAAEEQVADGAAVLKAIASPVPARPGERPASDSFGVESLRAISEVAHAAGLRVTAHAHGLAGARDAVSAGVDCIEHGYRLDGPTVWQMAEQGTWLVPTMVAMEASQAPARAPGQPDERIRRARERWQAAVEAVRLAHHAGIRIATGTDSFAIVPIAALHREVELLVTAADLTPAEALTAATGGAATLLGIDGVAGTVAAGRQADLLLVDGDPTVEPGCLGRISGVWRRGVRVL